MKKQLATLFPIMEEHIRLLNDNAALQAENERLRKAGDAMAKLLSCAGSPPSEVADWLAAKEGRDAK